MWWIISPVPEINKHIFEHRFRKQVSSHNSDRYPKYQHGIRVRCVHTISVCQHIVVSLNCCFLGEGTILIEVKSLPNLATLQSYIILFRYSSIYTALILYIVSRENLLTTRIDVLGSSDELYKRNLHMPPAHWFSGKLWKIKTPTNWFSGKLWKINGPSPWIFKKIMRNQYPSPLISRIIVENQWPHPIDFQEECGKSIPPAHWFSWKLWKINGPSPLISREIVENQYPSLLISRKIVENQNPSLLISRKVVENQWPQLIDFHENCGKSMAPAHWFSGNLIFEFSKVI